MTLNDRALRFTDRLAADAESLRIAVSQEPGGARILDCGVQAVGGLSAGLGMARVCLADLADVTLLPPGTGDLPCPLVQVVTDHPVLACMASQYAGWQISVGKFFAMGSGPMRAAYGKEELFDHVPGRERPEAAVGVLETRKPPTPEATAYLAEKLQLPPDRLTLLIAPTASIARDRAGSRARAGNRAAQAARAEIRPGSGGFRRRPRAASAASGDRRRGHRPHQRRRPLRRPRRALGAHRRRPACRHRPRVPSSASRDHGAPFAEIFERYNRDFYKIDPLLFSPAEVVFHNLRTGRSHAFGRLEAAVLRRSFLG